MTKLQKIRIKRNITQSKLAERSGVSVRLIQQYEQGVRRIDGAKLETLCDLAAALNCRLEDIIESRKIVTKLRAIK